MITKVILAKLSPTMEEGSIVKWTKNEGDTVKVGDIVAEIETDKANMEMEALGAGVLRKILVAAGGKAPVGTLIGVIAAPEDDISAVLVKAAATSAPPSAPSPATAPPGVAPAPVAPPPTAPSAPVPAVSSGPVAPAPVAPPPAVSPVPAPISGPQAVTAAPHPAPSPQAGSASPAPAGSGERVKASPLARSMAAQQHIPLSLVPGSGPGGRIVKKDIESYRPGGDPPPAAPARQEAIPPEAGKEIPLSSMRKTIARRLSESLFTAPHFYVTVEIDMDPAVALRDQLQKGEDTKISFTDLIVKACAKALKRFPGVNASWGGETIRTHGEVHVGVAVSIPDGLITPVVRNADRKSVLEISREVKALAGRARERRLKPEEYTGSTFTISNLGMYDVTDFTAIINPPEGAILAVGSVRRVPVVDEDRIRPGNRMRVTLSSDHRLIDGVLAAQFLGEVRRFLENPVSLFV
ncbi:MAG TPA: pyruvate dehydrogenase complex dihydrolipoamide acetyltransferase [Vicinamibacteria bacterium]|jgi:pyruvate dehydrogenase E2 component (dihydrolipoamide acetyltransferase)|nr:pyruvate dehydrogenase complex dihydrolipoamide acetyltransferase [Vicinamibacteria bacterium]